MRSDCSVRSARTFRLRNAVQAQAHRDVLGDGHGGKRIGFLEDHADAAAHNDGLDSRA